VALERTLILFFNSTLKKPFQAGRAYRMHFLCSYENYSLNLLFSGVLDLVNVQLYKEIWHIKTPTLFLHCEDDFGNKTGGVKNKKLLKITFLVVSWPLLSCTIKIDICLLASHKSSDNINVFCQTIRLARSVFMVTDNIFFIFAIIFFNNIQYSCICLCLGARFVVSFV